MCRDSPDLQELRGRIIQVFFKHLTSSNEIAVDMSQEGLAAVIAYQKMPKTLLQVGKALQATSALKASLVPQQLSQWASCEPCNCCPGHERYLGQACATALRDARKSRGLE